MNYSFAKSAIHCNTNNYISRILNGPGAEQFQHLYPGLDILPHINFFMGTLPNNS